MPPFQAFFKLMTTNDMQFQALDKSLTAYELKEMENFTTNMGMQGNP